MKEKWQGTAVLLLVVLVVGYILGRSGLIPGANAQAASGTNQVAVVMGADAVDERTPFVVVDPLEQAVMVYEWDGGSRVMYLRAIRSYRYDRLIPQFGNADGSPSVNEVQRRVQQ